MKQMTLEEVFKKFVFRSAAELNGYHNNNDNIDLPSSLESSN